MPKMLYNKMGRSPGVPDSKDKSGKDSTAAQTSREGGKLDLIRELKQQTFLSSRTSNCRGDLDRQRRFWRALGNTDGNILFIFSDWYFGALIFSVVNAAAKRRSKFAFDRSQ